MAFVLNIGSCLLCALDCGANIISVSLVSGKVFISCASMLHCFDTQRLEMLNFDIGQPVKTDNWDNTLMLIRDSSIK